MPRPPGDPIEAALRVTSLTEYLTFHVPARVGLVNITTQVEAAVRRSGVTEGLVLVSATRSANPAGVASSIRPTRRVPSQSRPGFTRRPPP